MLMFSRNGVAPSATDGSEPRVNSDVVSSIMDQSVVLKDCYQYI